jgi:hypothetical protein
MRNLWVLLIVFAVAFCLGCGKKEEGDKPANGDAKGGDKAGIESPPSKTTLTGAEAVADKIFADLKAGKIDALVAHTDVEGIYKQIPQEEGAEMTLEEFEQQMRQGLQQTMAGGVPPEAEYMIVGSETQGTMTLVKIRLRESPQAEWEEMKFPLANIDGEWKLTAECFEMLGNM